ncbi:hypothetical protein [Pseudoalteromonas atlantica]|uniref:hypothetical protein n=1 Tax=Pseudoalteromonas atlantica TaxID=288 RepID=UPI003A981373
MNRKFKVAYIHMGADKTGSTTLQSFMDSNRKINESEYGIYYAPEVWQARFASHFSGSSKNFIHNVHSGVQNEAEILALDNAYMESLERWLEGIVNPKTLVLSYEGFHCLTVNSLQAMREYLLKYADEVKVIYYIRAPLSYAISSKSQHIKMGLAIGDDFPISPYKALIQKIQKAFSKSEISIRKFSKNDLYQSDLVMDFIYSIDQGYDFKEYLANKKTENESLSDLACFVGNKVIEKYFCAVHRKNHSPFELGHRLLPHLINIEGDKLKLTPAQLNTVLSNSEENISYIKDEFDIDLRESEDKFIYDVKELLEVNSNSFQSKVDNMAEQILSSITESPQSASRELNININPDTVVFEDIKNGLDIDFLRDEAVKCESFDLNKAYKLMELAYRARPEGPFIKAKVEEYRARLGI